MLDLLLEAIRASGAVADPVKRLADKILEQLRNDPDSEKLKREIDAILHEEQSTLKRPRPEKRAAARRVFLEERQREFHGTQKTTLDHLTESLQTVTSAYNKSMTQELERAINTFRYTDFGSLEENKSAAKQIQQLVKRVGFRFRDPKSGKPANLICKESNSDAHGRFYFEYCEDGVKKTGASFAFLPPLEVVPSGDEEVLIAALERIDPGMLFDDAA